MIVITSKIPGFRRAGMAHPATATEHPDGTFTPKQIEQLKAEPMLMVVERPDAPALEGEPGKEPKGGKKTKGKDGEAPPPSPDEDDGKPRAEDEQK